MFDVLEDEEVDSRGVESLGAHGWVSKMSVCLVCWRMRK